MNGDRSATPGKVVLMHVFPTFDLGGAQVRTLNLMVGLGRGFRHLVAAADGRAGAAAGVEDGVDFELCEAPPKAGTAETAWGYRRLLLRWKPDLLLTYNWGAIEAAMGALLGTGVPFLHCEDGFGADEAQGLKRRRVWTRRLILRGAAAVVVPSRTLERIALEQYRLPSRTVRYIPNGVDTVRFAPQSNPAAKAALGIPPEAEVVGTVGHLRPEKNLGLLIESFAGLKDRNARLLIAGGGGCLEQLRAAAERQGCQGRVVFAGLLSDPAPAYAAMDVFALSSDTEQMPVALLEAMACGLPAVCTDVGDCGWMLGDAAVLTPPGDAAALTAALKRLLEDEGLRKRLGAQNRASCERRFSRNDMIESYRKLYLWAAGRGPAPEELE